MNILPAGNYLGTKTESWSCNKITVSKAEYCTIENKDWHCHENSFFAYFLKGGNYEYRRSKEIKCSPGTLLFYPAMEPHCNKAYSAGCKILHVEIDSAWVYEKELKKKSIEADVIDHLVAKNIFAHILEEYSLRDELSGDCIENILLYLWNFLSRNSRQSGYMPAWVKRFNSIKYECINDKPTLAHISKQLNIHPVTLSKEFPQYYHCSFGNYIRQLRVEKSLPLLAKRNIPINDIAFQCGFSDTSNFIRSFKKVKGVTPNTYRQAL